MAADILLTALDQIPKGEGRTFAAGGRTVAVFHTQAGEVYATQSHCPHLQGPLADGLLGGSAVVCPLHDRVFDMKTGCGLSHEHMTIETYPVRVEAGQIWMSPVPNPVAASSVAA